MSVWVVLHEWVFGGESYRCISRIFKDEESAETWVDSQDKKCYEVEEWEVE